MDSVALSVSVRRIFEEARTFVASDGLRGPSERPISHRRDRRIICSVFQPPSASRGRATPLPGLSHRTRVSSSWKSTPMGTGNPELLPPPMPRIQAPIASDLISSADTRRSVAKAPRMSSRLERRRPARAVPSRTLACRYLSAPVSTMPLVSIRADRVVA
jgi:hypothetical protein